MPDLNYSLFKFTCLLNATTILSISLPVGDRLVPREAENVTLRSATHVLDTSLRVLDPLDEHVGQGLQALAAARQRPHEAVDEEAEARQRPRDEHEHEEPQDACAGRAGHGGRWKARSPRRSVGVGVTASTTYVTHLSIRNLAIARPPLRNSGRFGAVLCSTAEVKEWALRGGRAEPETSIDRSTGRQRSAPCPRARARVM